MTNEPAKSSTQDRFLVVIVVFLFFAWGFATVLIDTLVPKLKGLFSLNYTEVMLTQFSFFIGYFVFSIPAAFILSRIGYMRGAILGLVVMAAGCLLFAPAAALGLFPAFLLALFVMAAGITLLQVVANPFIELLGSERTSHSRLTLAQAFNSLGTTIGPWVGAATILAGGVTINSSGLSDAALAALRRTQAHAVQLPFLVIAAALVAIAIVFWFMRNSTAPRVAPDVAKLGAMLAMLDRPRVALGAIAIFVYVGAEVSIGSVMTNYLMQPTVLGVHAADVGRAIGAFVRIPNLFSDNPVVCAGQMVSFYWGGAMIGRFIGSFVLTKLRPGYVLSACAVCTCALALISSRTTGETAAFSLLAVGLFNSIMFPTIFALATEQLGPETPNGSGLLIMAIVGGAIVPEITGKMADLFGLAASLVVPAVCYLWIIFYGIAAARGLGLKARNAAA